MEKVKVNILNNSENPLPKYATEFSAGLDLSADFSMGVNTKFFNSADYDEVRNVILIFSGGRALIPTNLYTEIPNGYEAQIRPRSGLALKEGITVLNTPGTIDADYRNSWGVVLINLSDNVFEVAQGDRIAQAVFSKVEQIEWVPVDSVGETNRKGGFGHTGIK